MREMLTHLTAAAGRDGPNASERAALLRLARNTLSSYESGGRTVPYQLAERVRAMAELAACREHVAEIESRLPG